MSLSGESNEKKNYTNDKDRQDFVEEGGILLSETARHLSVSPSAVNNRLYRLNNLDELVKSPI